MKLRRYVTSDFIFWPLIIIWSLNGTCSPALTHPETVEWWIPNFLAVSLKVWSTAKRRTSSFRRQSDSSPRRRCWAMTESRFFLAEISFSDAGSRFSLLEPGLHCWLGLGLDSWEEEDGEGEKTAKDPFEIKRLLSIGEDGRIRGGRGEN